MTRYWINLTNGLYHPLAHEAHSVCRIQSTWLEQQRWEDVLMAVPDGLLYELARGLDVVVLDCYANGKPRKWGTRAVWQGLPLIREALCFHLGLESQHRWKAHPIDDAAMFDIAWSTKVAQKYGYFRHYYDGHVGSLLGDCVPTEYDGRYDVAKQMSKVVAA